MDYINTLPVDDSPISPDHAQLIDTITHTVQETTLYRFFNELRVPIILALVFFVLSLPYGSDVIRTLVPYTQKKEVSLVIAKTFFFALVAFILTYNKP